MGIIDSLLKWWVGSTDGENYVVTNDPRLLPKGARAMPLGGLPARKPMKLFKKYGLKVKIRTTRDN